MTGCWLQLSLGPGRWRGCGDVTLCRGEAGGGTTIIILIINPALTSNSI